MKKTSLALFVFVLGTVIVYGQINFNELQKIKNGTEQENPTNYDYSLHKSGNIITDYGEPPDWSWVSEFGGTGVDYSSDIIMDEDGNIYMTGRFSGEISIEGNSYVSLGDWDGIVAKFDISGNFIWLTQFYAQEYKKIVSNDINIDADGNIYVTGYYTGAATIGDFTLPGNSSESLFFVKLNNEGGVLLAKNNGTNSYSGLKINSDGDGNIFVLGKCGETTGWNHYSELLKYSSSGNLLTSLYFEQVFNNMVIHGNSIYFTGAITEAGYIGTIWVEPTNSGNLFVAESDLNFSFNQITVAEATSNGYSVGESMFCDDDGSLYVAGRKKGDLQVGNITFENYPPGFLLKFSSSCEPVWGKDIYTLNIYQDIKITGGYGKLFLFYNFSGANLYEYNIENGDEINSSVYFYKMNEFCYNPVTYSIVATGVKNDLIYLSLLNEAFSETWFKSFSGDSGNARVCGIVTDNDKNAYVYGYTTSDIDYFGQVQDEGLFLAKHNINGEILWKKTFLCDDFKLSSYGSYNTIDSINNYVYITGTFYSSLTIPEYTVLIPELSGSVFIIKYDFDGNFIWAKKNDFDGDELCLSPDNAGNILLSGIFYSEIINIGGTTLTSNGFSDVFIAKYGNDGEAIWATSGGGETDEFSGLVATDSDNNIYFTGEFTSENVTFGNSQITLLEGDGNIVFAKLNSNGEVLWLTSKAGSTVNYGDWYCWPTGIKTDNEGYIYIKGWHTDSTYFDNFLLLSPDYNYSYFIGKFDPDGNTVWVNSIRMHLLAYDFNQMDVDFEGSVYLGAQVRDTLEFGDDYTYYPVEGMTDIFVSKYKTNGELEWVKTAQGNNGTAAIQSVAFLDKDNIITGGYFMGNFSVGDEQLYSNNRHGFVALLSDIVGVEENETGVDLFDISPNPAKSYFSITFNDGAVVRSLSIVNVNGEIVYRNNNISRKRRLLIDTSILSKGIYFIRIETDKSYQTKKIVIN